jgi:putative copper export protein
VARFSLHAAWAVPAIFVCGVVMSRLFVPSLAEYATPYGGFVLFKAGVFAVLMGFAASNKWHFGRRLADGDDRAVPGLLRAIKLEWVLIAAVLVVTAAMTSLYAPEHLDGSFAPEHEPVLTH